MKILTAFLTVAITLSTVQASIAATTPQTATPQTSTPQQPPHRGSNR